MEKNSKAYIQIGVTIPRDPNGKYLPSVPLYIEADNLQRSGLTATHENALTDIAGFFIEKYGERLRADKQPLIHGQALTHKHQLQPLGGEAAEGAV